MPLPIAANVRFAIYRATDPPPADPAATDVPGYLEGAYDEGLEKAESLPAFRYTHLLLVDGDVDLRDDFRTFGVSDDRDVIYIPDASGTPFEVVFVERPFRGGAIDVRRVFLNRRLPPWPTSDL